MNTSLAATVRGRLPLAPVADGLAVAVVVSLPWSTSATGILIVLWLVALVPTLDLAAVRRELATPAGGLPVLLWSLGVIGMAWADATLGERIDGIESFHKLLAIPLLLAQFRRSENGNWIFIGFLASAVVLLIASCAHAALVLSGYLPLRSGAIAGVPVKDYISQGGVFQICIFGLAYVAAEAWRSRRYRLAPALLLLVAALLADIAYVATGRTTLAVMPVLLVLFGWRELGWKGVLAVVVAGIALAAALWASSPYLRGRVTAVVQDVELYRAGNGETSSGLRVEFWKKSLGFVAEAPLLGHGTGSINERFRRAAEGETGAAAVASHNPHQQTLAVAIQLGLLGTAALFAMWIAHLALFFNHGPCDFLVSLNEKRSRLAAWIGLVIVVQNVVASLFNSHLFDFTQGWLYVFGVGMLGGMVRRERSMAPAATSGRANIPA